MKLTFTYDIHQDLWNYFFHYINPAIDSQHQISRVYGGKVGLNNLNKASLPKTTASLILRLPELLDNEPGELAAEIYTFLEQNIIKTSLSVDASDKISKEWQKYEANYLSRLKRYFGISRVRPMQAYLTSIFGCPYNADAGTFFVPMEAYREYTVHTIMHEMMHIVFLDNFTNLMKQAGVNSEGVSIITEAVAELLCLEFRDIDPMQGKRAGTEKDGVQPYSERIEKLWREGEEFSRILDELIIMAKDAGFCYDVS